MGAYSTSIDAPLRICGVLFVLQGVVIAGPVARSSRMIREVYPEIEPEKLEGSQAEVCIVGDVVYGAEEAVPADQPCLTCRCRPPGVHCETTKCLKKPGCRAIHKPNKCCPEYQCECEHEGKFYANGERLETTPGGECRVCYCRGGEVQCADVSCYIRTDCEGRTVPGQCCPKYDHCPPREPIVLDRVVPSYTTQISSTNNDLSQPVSNSSEEVSTTPIYDLREITDEDSNKITEAQTDSFLIKISTNPETNDTQEDFNTIHIQVKDEDNVLKNENLPEVPKITIQEIIPEIKEIPITGPPKREINLQTHVAAEDLKTSPAPEDANTDEKEIADAETDSSEITEVYHHPPPVLKIGDQLLFLKKGELVPGNDISTPVPVITIIGAEGLQRGTEESVEFHEVPSQNPDREENKEKKELTTEGNQSTHIISLVKTKSDEESTKSSLSTIENFFVNITKSEDFEFSSLDEDVKTNVESTTETVHVAQKIEVEATQTNTSTSENQDTTPVPTVILLEKIEVDNATEEAENTTIVEIKDLTEVKVKEEEVPLEQNPEYPPIPEIMSSQNIDELADHIETELQTFSEEPLRNITNENCNETNPEERTLPDEKERILPEVLDARDNQSIPQTNHSDWLKNINKSHPLINQDAALPETLLKEVAYSDKIEDDEEDLRAISSKSLQLNDTDADRSKETVEESTSEDSGEATTPPNLHASILLSVEDASVESIKSSSELNLSDLVETVPGMATSTEEVKVIKTTPRPEPKDVEIIDPAALMGKNKENTTQERRLDDESESIFKQLNKEIEKVPSHVIDNKTGNEDAEAEAIFRELLEEATSSTLPPKEIGFPKARDKESELLQRVSDAITKFQLKESKESLDASILGILKDFFSSQYKYYDSEN